MTGRRIITLIAAGALALGGVGLPLWELSGLDRPAEATAEASLPWPYCAPDADPPAPSPTPWPTLPMEPHVFVDPAPAPLATAIVSVAALRPSSADIEVEPWFRPATVLVDELVWPKAVDIGIAPGTEVTVAGSPELLTVPVDGGGTKVLMGLGVRRGELWNVAFAAEIDGDRARFIGAPPFAERQTLILEAFRTWGDNPVAGSSARDLIVAWNDEAVRASGPRPIADAWRQFVDEVVLGRARPLQPGTLEWWDAAPALCRSVLDAPAAIRDRLTSGTVWVRIPSVWADVTDAVLCLKIPLGSAGCASFGAYSGWPYVRFDEAYAVPGEPIEVQVAHVLQNGAVSWVERRTVAEIPFDTFIDTGIVLVDLSSAASSMSTYADLDIGLEPDRVPVRSLTREEEEGLLLEASQRSVSTDGVEPAP